MKKYRVLRWLGLWLAFALLASAPVVAQGEAPEEVVLEVESDAPEEAVSELAPDALLDVRQDEALVNAADELPGPVPGAVDGGEEAGQTSAEEEEDTSIRLEQESLTLGLKEKRTLSIVGGATPQSVGAVFTSSKSKVASVNKTTGRVTARKRGTAIIRMETANGDVSTCTVTVKRAPSNVKISKRSLTLGVGEEKTLKVTLSSRSASAITFTSSNKKVARVDEDGKITALKKGTAKITARTFNGKKAVCKLTVKKAPKALAFSASRATLWSGDSLALTVKLSKNSAGSYKLSSDNEAVATVSGTKLKAVGAGSATITATAYNGVTALMSVEVRRRPAYRALLIGECHFKSTTYCDLPAKKDVSLMQKMLKSTKGPAMAKWSVTTQIDRTSAQIHSDIQKAFEGAQEGDISLFYISTHGDEQYALDGENPEYAGYLMTYPDPDENITDWYDKKVLTLPTLASWLKAVPGQVVVIIDSCGSGAAIYGATSNAARSTFTPGAFDNAVVNAFEAEDGGAVVPAMEEGAFVLKNKFYVLTSAGYQEACWTNNGKYSYFTKWLTEGVGTKGRMAADSNKNKLVTLHELYKYISKRSKKVTITDKKGKVNVQHVQVYPSGSSFELFYRK